MQMLRSVLSSDFTKHSRTPKELLYLEKGTIPIRLNFLWYLLNQNEDSMLSQFFWAQSESPTRGDWVSSAKQDLEDLEIEMTFEEIKACTKEAFKDIVKKHVKVAALTMLTKLQQTRWKSNQINYLR